MTAAPQSPPMDNRVVSAPGPGRLLRSARESAGIGLREVSAQMHLDVRTITALESDDFEVLPAPTFVRGYLRGYARLLGVPVGPVMEAYDREGFKPPDLVADIAEKPQANTADFPVRLTTYVVVGVLAALVVLWWNNQGFDSPSPPAPQTETAAPPGAPTLPGAAPATSPPPALAAAGADTATGSPAAAGPKAPQTRPVPRAPALTPPAQPAETDLPAGGESVTSASPTRVGAAAGAGSAVATASPAGPAADEAIARAEEVLERTRERVDALAAAATPPATPATGASPADSGTTATVTPGPGGEPGTGPAPPTVAARAGAPDTAPQDGTARLRISFPVEAWVEIHDRNEARLFYNLVQPGRELDLRGEPPIRVLLGRTEGVTMEYNGKAVDLTPYTERGVARFTLGR